MPSMECGRRPTATSEGPRRAVQTPNLVFFEPIRIENRVSPGGPIERGHDEEIRLVLGRHVSRCGVGDGMRRVEHAVTSDAAGKFTVDVDGNEQGTLTAPSEPGEYAFHCKYHPSMHGTLIVK